MDTPLHRQRGGAALRAAAGFVLAGAALFASCGGGGGGDDGGTTPPPAGGTSGTVWHNSLATDATSGSKRSVFTGAVTRAVDARPTAVPSRDGSQYVVWEYDTRAGVDETAVELKATASGAVLQSRVLTGYARAPRPSPLDPALVIVTWGSTPTSGDDEQVIVDLAAGAVVDTIGGADVSASWLPDGRFIALLANGDLVAAAPGGTRSTLGRITVAGRTPAGVWANAQGTQLLTQWQTVSGDRVLKDLWISNASGANLARFTQTDQSYGPVWSHDGRFVAYTNQAETVCTGFSCPSFPCEVVHAPATARSLGLPDAAATDLRVMDSNGDRTVALGCRINGWTP